MNPLVVANWKCNPSTLKEGEELLEKITDGAKDFKGAEVVICPPSIFISSLIKKFNIPFGTQNCYFEDKGAFTGETSIPMLEDFGAKYVIIGHSERRNIFKETNEEINLKLIRVLNSKIIPILCIGENGGERESNKTFEILSLQLEKCLLNVPMEKAGNIVLAYEPVWAIGTGKFAGITEIEEVRAFICKFLSDKFGKEICDKIRILYGGSVDSNNVHSYISEAKMDGVLVGGSSLKADEFLKLIKSA
jgi:triosephosphate isomerase